MSTYRVDCVYCAASELLDVSTVRRWMEEHDHEHAEGEQEA